MIVEKNLQLDWKTWQTAQFKSTMLQNWIDVNHFNILM